MRGPVAAGARVVVLDDTLAQVGFSQDQRALPFYYKWGPVGRDISDPSYQGAQRSFEGVGLRPLSPVHVRGTWQSAGGDIALSWKRRTRIGGDSWEQTEVPLGEDSEVYEVDILDGPTVVRTLSATTPSATYTLAQQTADFGSAQSTLTTAAYQLSPSTGRGAGRTTTLYY